MRFVTVIAALITACGGSLDIEIENNTDVYIDTGVIRAMAHRMCPTCDGGLKVEIHYQSDAPRIMKTGSKYGEAEYGPGRTDTIRLLLFGGDCVVDQLHGYAHELVHWRLKKLTGDGNSMHDAIDWYLEDKLNEEFACTQDGT